MQHAANTAGTIIMKCEDFEPDLSRGKKIIFGNQCITMESQDESQKAIEGQIMQ